MAFNKIDLEMWGRKNTYNTFVKYNPCTYSMTVNINITSLLKIIKQTKLKFFPVFLYGLSHIVNSHKEFRMDLDSDGNVGYFDETHPSFTVLDEKNDTFSNIWCEYQDNFLDFLELYNKNMMDYSGNSLISQPSPDKNIFNVSCIPWTSFAGFNLNLQNGYDYFPPIFTIGKYFDNNGETYLPLALQVHHAVCDGFHASRFVNNLQLWCDNFNL